MLAALLMMFFLGGSAGGGLLLNESMLDDVGERIEKQVGDADRATQAAGELDALRSVVGDFGKTYAKTMKELSAQYRDHRADPIRMRADLDTLDAEWERAQSLALDRRFAIRDSMSREEWNGVFGDR